MTDQQQASAARLLAKAERTNRRRDAAERANGFAAPPDGPWPETVRTAISALHAGVQMQDWDCVAEGTAMLGDLVNYRPWTEKKA